MLMWRAMLLAILLPSSQRAVLPTLFIPAPDINREADEFEEQLRKSREKQEVSCHWNAALVR
jgi:hypothetical protein